MNTTQDINTTPDKASTLGLSSSPGKTIPLCDLPLRPRHFWLMIVSQMEQTIALVLTVAIGVLLPMMKLYDMHVSGSQPSVLIQGCVAASAWVGLTLGAPLIGAIGDRHGYLGMFRLSALLIFLGGMGAWLLEGSIWFTVASLFVCGLGVGGGYSVDDVYLSELMPTKWRSRMIGLAKTIAAAGGCWSAFLAYGILRLFPDVDYWRYSMMMVAALGALSLLMRIRWWQSPKWLMINGKPKEALSAAGHFFGLQTVPAPAPSEKVTSVTFAELFKGRGIWKVIATSIPWAMSGVTAYGMASFLPVILMGLGLHIGAKDATGVTAVENSVLLTAVINIFLPIGFFIGLVLLNRVYHIRLMAVGFVVSAIAIFGVLCGHTLALPAWISILAFVVYQTVQCAGPGMITFLLPSEVFTPEERGAGAGFAASIGKVGAILGVFLMPIILKYFGTDGVLIVCGCAMLIGGLVTYIAGRKALPNPHK